ncbi:MAG: hypothetical protein M1155_00295 [Patescibacteria group bacterium]|nr:hypothetical protein [Patescibacteria group bacterium]
MSIACTGSYDILHPRLIDMNRKRRYSGRHMTIYGYVLPGAVSLAN